MKLDSAAKEFIWKAIVDMSGVEFFVLDKPLPHVSGAKCSDADEMQLMRSTNPVGQVLFVFFLFLEKRVCLESLVFDSYQMIIVTLIGTNNCHKF